MFLCASFNVKFLFITPLLGTGLYLHSSKWYVGLSVPNVLETDHYDSSVNSVASDRIHGFLIAGYVFDITSSIKLKPSVFAKAVSGAPLIADASLNALFNDKFTLGLAYRWDDAISGLAGFQINDSIFVGYAYDGTTTGLSQFNNGTHEILFRFELSEVGKILSPRFF